MMHSVAFLAARLPRYLPTLWFANSANPEETETPFPSVLLWVLIRGTPLQHWPAPQ